MFLSLGSAQIDQLRAQTGRRVLYFGLLAVFGLLLVIFGLGAITAALAAELGLVAALAIMAAAALLGCLVVLVLMKSAERRYRAVAAERAELQRRLSQLAMLSAFGAARPRLGQVVGLGVLAAGAILILGRMNGKPAKDPDRDS